jgi:UDP-N-acetylmuramate dehydrogenase
VEIEFGFQNRKEVVLLSRDKIIRLRRELGEMVRENVSLAELTAYRTGGAAACFLQPGSLEQLKQALLLLDRLEIDFVILGGGSNLLVAEEGVRERVVISLAEGFSGLELVARDDWSATVRVESGVRLSRLVRYCAEQGYAGCERLAGIPGTVGGAVAMNAGAYGQSLSDNLAALQLMIAGHLLWRSRGGLKPAYRDGGLAAQEVVVAAYFLFERRDPAALQESVAETLSLRRRLPAGRHAGSVFKNPPGDYAGRLLEEAGCKELRCGKAHVSGEHANVIVAEPGACSSEIMELVEKMRRRVEARSGVRLETEIRIFS